MKISQAKYDANTRYNRKAYEQIAITVRRDAEINADTIRRYAEWKKTSVNALIKNLVEREIRGNEEFTI